MHVRLAEMIATIKHTICLNDSEQSEYQLIKANFSNRIEHFASNCECFLLDLAFVKLDTDTNPRFLPVCSVW